MKTSCKAVVWGFYPGKHKGAGGDFGDDRVFRDRGLIGIGWPLTGDLVAFIGQTNTLPLLIEQVRKEYSHTPIIKTLMPEKQEQWFRKSAGTIYRFLCEAKPGDTVVYACKLDRQVHIGKIRDDEDGRYKYDGEEQAVKRLHWHFRHFRAVQWLKQVPYDLCSKQDLAQAQTQNTFWRMKACPEKFLVAL